MIDAGIYALLDVDRLGLTAGDRPALEAAVAYAAAARHAGAVALQLRFKSAPLGDPRRIALARAVAAALQGGPAALVDDDVEAAAAAACGVHLGQRDAPPATARARLGAAVKIGWSTHDLAQVEAAQALPVAYLGFGPVRATASKANPEPVTGWAQLSDACKASALPIVAIGGLEAQDVATARACGAAAVAVMGAWLGPAATPWSPEQAYAALAGLVEQWQRAAALDPRGRA